MAVAQAIAPMVLLVFLLVGGFYSRAEDIPVSQLTLYLSSATAVPPSSETQNRHAGTITKNCLLVRKEDAILLVYEDHSEF